MNDIKIPNSNFEVLNGKYLVDFLILIYEYFRKFALVHICSLDMKKILLRLEELIDKMEDSNGWSLRNRKIENFNVASMLPLKSLDDLREIEALLNTEIYEQNLVIKIIKSSV